MDSRTGHVGIDFGARSSGNTVVCVHQKGLFRFHRSTKDADGDAWLQHCIADLCPQAIYIDAPLSLPGAYLGKGSDHFFRVADRQAGGMSPMFLGGLTARAMALASGWRRAGIEVYEAYPAALIRHAWENLGIRAGATIPASKLRIMAGMVLLPPPEPADRHEADAWLCWVIGHRHQRGEAKAYGTTEEGMILA